jgi:hypothetical protein
MPTPQAANPPPPIPCAVKSIIGAIVGLRRASAGTQLGANGQLQPPGQNQFVCPAACLSSLGPGEYHTMMASCQDNKKRYRTRPSRHGVLNHLALGKRIPQALSIPQALNTRLNRVPSCFKGTSFNGHWLVWQADGHRATCGHKGQSSLGCHKIVATPDVASKVWLVWCCTPASGRR